MNKVIAPQKQNKMITQDIILIITATLTALIAGLYYAYSCSINGGLGTLPDEGYMAAMQSINRQILNPVFFLSFMGTLLFLPVSAWLQYRGEGASTTFYLLLAAALIYFVASFGVTMMGNVPLNETLDKFNLKSASAEEIARQRAIFEIPWNKLHSIRTIASVVSLVLVIIACLSRPGGTIKSTGEAGKEVRLQE